MQKRIVILFIFSVMLFSCKPTYIRQGMKQIDSLRFAVDDAALRLNTLDTALVKEKFDLYMGTIAKMKTFDDDRFDKDEWETMTQYGQIRKPVRNFLQEMRSFFYEVNYSKSQLENLQYDLKKKYINEEKFNEYFQKEKETVNLFLMKFNIYLDGLQSQLNAYDTLYPKILLVIERHDNN